MLHKLMRWGLASPGYFAKPFINLSKRIISNISPNKFKQETILGLIENNGQFPRFFSTLKIPSNAALFPVLDEKRKILLVKENTSYQKLNILPSPRKIGKANAQCDDCRGNLEEVVVTNYNSDLRLWRVKPIVHDAYWCSHCKTFRHRKGGVKEIGELSIRAQNFIKSKQYERAELCYHRILQLSEWSLTSVVNLGYLYLEMFQAYKKQLDTFSSDYVVQLADNATQLLLHAVQHFQKTVPPKVYMQLGYLYRDHYQDNETSIRYYEECLKRENNDKDFELFVKRLRAEQDITEGEQIVQKYKQIANVNATNLTTEEKEILREGVNKMQKGIKFFISRNDKRFVLAQGYLMLEEVLEAREQFKTLLDREPNNALFAFHLIKSCFMLGDDDMAHAVLRRSWKNSETDYRIMFMGSVAALLSGELSAAENLAKTALFARPKDTPQEPEHESPRELYSFCRLCKSKQWDVPTIKYGLKKRFGYGKLT